MSMATKRAAIIVTIVHLWLMTCLFASPSTSPGCTVMLSLTDFFPLCHPFPFSEGADTSESQLKRTLVSSRLAELERAIKKVRTFHQHPHIHTRFDHHCHRHSIHQHAVVSILVFGWLFSSSSTFVILYTSPISEFDCGLLYRIR